MYEDDGVWYPTIPVLPSYELADTLAEQHNGYAAMMEGFEEMEAEDILPLLDELINEEDLKFLVEDDFGRGLLMGTLHTIFLMRLVNALANEEVTDTEEAE